MAKSIYEILADLQTETSVPDHGMVSHSLPADLFPTPEQFENDGELLAWANENEITHAVLQKGVQKFLIELRAIFKSVKKEEDWTPAAGQAKVNEASWEVTKRPGTGTSKKVDQARFNDCLAMIANLVGAKMKQDKIIGIVSPIYGDTVVNACFEALNTTE